MPAQNFKKCTFLDNLQTVNQEGNTKTRQMNALFSSTFSALFVTLISEIKNIQNSFSCGAPFGPFRSVKYLNF